MTDMAQNKSAQKLATLDPIWARTREQAAAQAKREPMLASFLHATVLNHDKLEGALSYHLSHKIGGNDLTAMSVRQLIDEAFADAPSIGEAVRADMAAVYDRDPACTSYVQVLLYFKGFHALQTYRVAHWLWQKGRESMALYFQSLSSEKFAVDIHPAAKIGRGIMIDHATGVVIGETAVVEDDVSILHGVTLGGTGKDDEDRHPKVRRGVLIGAGAKVLGNIEVGESARIAAGSVVLKAVPARCTVAGVPARTVSCEECDLPARTMNQLIDSDGMEFLGDGI